MLLQRTPIANHALSAPHAMNSKAKPARAAEAVAVAADEAAMIADRALMETASQPPLKINSLH
jgi:hypothetical protein